MGSNGCWESHVTLRCLLWRAVSHHVHDSSADFTDLSGPVTTEEFFCLLLQTQVNNNQVFVAQTVWLATNNRQGPRWKEPDLFLVCSAKMFPRARPWETPHDASKAIFDLPGARRGWGGLQRFFWWKHANLYIRAQFLHDQYGPFSERHVTWLRSASVCSRQHLCYLSSVGTTINQQDFLGDTCRVGGWTSVWLHLGWILLLKVSKVRPRVTETGGEGTDFRRLSTRASELQHRGLWKWQKESTLLARNDSQYINGSLLQRPHCMNNYLLPSLMLPQTPPCTPVNRWHLYAAYIVIVFKQAGGSNP